ncbi:MAG: hypothetical protein ABH841_02565 [Candidatus Nealsonbacteria bacterium]
MGIYGFFKSFYGLKNIPFTHCDLVVPLGYGLLNHNKLPDASEKTLREAVKIANQYQAPIVWANVNYLWPECAEAENRLKTEKARLAGLTSAPIIVQGVTNSVTEAQNIRLTLEQTSISILQSKTIIVVADWPHARSARMIWREVFPESTVIIKSIYGRWNEHHPCFFQRSESRWLIINLIRHLALIILTAEGISRFRQPK